MRLKLYQYSFVFCCCFFVSHHPFCYIYRIHIVDTYVQYTRAGSNYLIFCCGCLVVCLDIFISFSSAFLHSFFFLFLFSCVTFLHAFEFGSMTQAKREIEIEKKYLCTIETRIFSEKISYHRTPGGSVDVEIF